ncbi:hypothetical protein [Pseudoalteromonas sp. J010]|uniref:hypothetical protein n=1 Tax=Pseudoalteromonas sp. J010 TaxID=998465 RepID=UPI0023B9EAFE|nr:hypothetical protein [Pseudoalteromonas sp. J010]
MALTDWGNTFGLDKRYAGMTPEVNDAEFTTIAKVIGSNLASKCSISLRGTTSNTVVNFSAKILVNHSGDIVVESLSGDYTQLELKILSNANENYLIQVRIIGGAPLSLSCYILSHTNDNVSIGNYSTANYPIAHIHKSKKSSKALSSINETNMFVAGNDVLHSGNVDEYLVGERKKPLVSGVIPAHSNVHLKTSDIFTLPPVAETPEDAVIVVSKRLSATPLLKTNSQEKIIMTRRGRTIEKNEVLFDTNCTLTFILNDEDNWEMQI